MGLSYEALLTKAKYFIEKAIDCRNDGDDQHYVFWATLALELLGKAVLAKTHPSLVVDPKDLDSLLVACGRSNSDKYKTIQAKTLYERCKTMVRGFQTSEESFCMRMAGYRNAHIHSSEVPFAGMQPKTWQAEFWKIVSLFLHEAGLSLDDFLGASEASATQHTMDEAAEEVAKSVSKRVRSHKDEFKKLDMNAQEEKLREGRAKSTVLEQDTDVTYTCPSCDGLGLLEGYCVDEESESPHPNMDEWDAISYALVTRTYEPEQFRCFTCGLKLNGLDELKIVQMDADFTKESDEEYEWEPDYGNE